MSYTINTDSHKSVMLKEVMQYLAPQKGEIIVDCTFGAGGYSKEILQNSESIVIGVDRDPDVLPFAKKLELEFSSERFSFVQTKFSQIKKKLKELNIEKVNGLVLDIGVSSMQLDTPERGFSFMHDADLDMRMERDGISAKQIVNSMKEVELANLIYEYGDERNSRRIAKAIVEHRRKNEINSTKELRSIIHSVSKKRGKIDSATKTFQALRIYVNKELEELEAILESALTMLAINGRIVVVTFHSLEDRIVKYFFRDKKENFEKLSKKAVKPEYIEIRQNPRARSSKLRAAIFKGNAEHE